MKNLISIITLHLIIVVSASTCYAESYWAKEYNYTVESEPRAVQQTSDLGYIIAVQHFEFSDYAYRVVKLTDAGEISWDKTIDQILANTVIISMTFSRQMMMEMARRMMDILSRAEQA